MKPIRYFILEDTPKDASVLKENLDCFLDLEYVGEASSVTDGVRKILETDPDLVFWDYNLIGGTGLYVLEQLDKLDIPLPYCVGASAFNNIKMEVYNRYQHLFLENFEKPFFDSHFPNRMKAVILKLRRLINPGESLIHQIPSGFIFIQSLSHNNPVVRVDIGQITRIEVNNTLVTIHLYNDPCIKVEIAMSRLLHQLDLPLLKQVNRNNVVNIRYIDRYENGRLSVAGQSEPISVSDGFKRRFEMALMVVNW